MSGIYNPYQKSPDIGQGFSDLANQIMSYLLLKKYMGQGQTTPRYPQGTDSGARPVAIGSGAGTPGSPALAAMPQPDNRQDTLLQLLRKYLGI
jgi:hypothetical protein